MKKNVKRILALFLATTMSFTLTACGEKSSNNAQANNTQEIETQENQSTAATEEKINGATIVYEDDAVKLVYDEPMIMLDDDLVKVTVSELRLLPEKSIEYFYEIENKSANKYAFVFTDQESFGKYTLDYSSYSGSGPNSIMPGKISPRTKGIKTDILKSADDILNFSGVIEIYPTDKPDTYGSSDCYSRMFNVEVTR